MEATNHTFRNRLTRMKIGESILHLLDKSTLEEIKISTLAKLAGISRMTFYHYYDTKEAALTDYFSELIATYVAEARDKGIEQSFHTPEHLEFTINFFAKYDRFLLKLEKIGCYHLLINGINQFLEKNYKNRFEASIYNLYFYAGALLNVFMRWIRNGKKESVKDLVSVILNNRIDALGSLS